MRLGLIERETITYFIENSMPRGTIVASVHPNRLQESQHIANKWSECPQTFFPIGILLNDVVSLDRTRRHINWYKDDVQRGGKVRILTKGKVILKMDKKLHLPYRQPIYADQKTNKLTWRKTGPKVGYVSLPQDKDGFLTVSVDFDRS